jgi:hypothetical protein
VDLRTPRLGQETAGPSTDTLDGEPHMSLSNNNLVNHLLIQAVVMFFLVWSLVGAAIGAGLIVSSAKTFRLFGMMNRYVSTRHGFKPLAMAHDIGQSVRKHRRLIGALFVLGAAYSIYSLLAWFNNSAIVFVLDLRYPRPFVAWILESARWSLIVLNVFALVIGVMLGFFPHALGRLEAQANRWVSVRKLTLGMDKMDLTLDKFVEAFPRTAGSVILVAALYVAANAAILWLRFH